MMMRLIMVILCVLCVSMSNGATKLAVNNQELQSLCQADQDDRKDYQNITAAKMNTIVKRDIVRRKRVAEIFAEGDIKTAADYHCAALIFQHGNVPDHFLQAFIWAKHSALLGYPYGNLLSALAIDRYLVSQGKKQIFGSQYSDMDSKAGQQCYCMQPVESSFPDKLRKHYAGRSLEDQYDVMMNIINKGKHCPRVECRQSLLPTPKRYWQKILMHN